jgi:hypothetical protein
MERRITERRRQDRRILAWCVGVAAALHVAALLLLPGLPETADPTQDLELERAEIVGGQAIPLDVFFGPPIIERAGGRRSFEPPTRVLEAQRAVFLPASCRRALQGTGRVFSGSVRLTVLVSGRVGKVSVFESTGARCSDDVLATVADDLWYLWLPTPEFPAPVDVIQPMTFVEIVGA